MFPYTYSNGPTFELQHDITKGDMISICEKLGLVFGVEHTFIPEPITEGGIKIENFPNKKNGSYKSIRFHYKEAGKWPWVDLLKLDVWKDNNEVIFTKLGKITTVLKAFHGAPCWSIDELQKLTTVFEQFNINLVKNSRQKDILSTKLKKELCSFGELGRPKINYDV